MCYHIDGEVPADEALKLMPSDQGPRSHANHLWEKAARLQARQVDLEAIEEELKRQRQNLARQQAAQPPSNDDNACTGAPSTLRFPRVAYNIAPARLREQFESQNSSLSVSSPILVEILSI
jgi:hypothetical protein